MVVRRDYTSPAEQVLQRVEVERIRSAFAEMFASTQEAIDAQQVDLVILAARRLVCVYQLLVNAGMPPLTGCFVVSDRYLEAGRDQFPDTPRSVIVLDDSVVVGTTLDRLRQKLNRIVPDAHVTYRAVCVDIDQVAYFLFDDDFQPICQCTSAEVEAYSNQLVLALFDGQVPLFTDFPITRPIAMQRDDWTAFLEEIPWHVADVSPPGFEGLRQWALTFVPHEDTQRRYLNRLEPAAASLVDTVKVRCFARETDGIVRIVLVPIALIRAAPPSELVTTLGSVAAGLSDLEPQSGLDWRGWDVEALHRLVQLYTSACILAEIWPDVLNRACSIQPLDASALERLPVDLYFGSSSDEVLEAFNKVVAAFKRADGSKSSTVLTQAAEEPVAWQLLRDDSVKRMLWATQATLETLGMPQEPTPGHMTKVGAVLGQSVSAVFGFVNLEYEIPQRREIRELGSIEAYRAWDLDPRRRVLRQGVTLQELVRNVFPDGLRSSGVWDKSVVSLGIDQGNDLGIIVPVTRYDPFRDLVYRCFRIGETALLTPRPLIEAVSGTIVSSDPFVAAMLKGAPAVSETMPIREGLHVQERRPMTRESLADFVLRRVPGVPVERYEGTVSAVHDGQVQARIVSSGSDELEFAQFPLSRLPGNGQDVRAGTAFVMSAFERSGEMERSREMRFRLRREPLIPAEAES